MITNTIKRSGPYKVTAKNRTKFYFEFEVPYNDEEAIAVYINDDLVPKKEAGSYFSVTFETTVVSEDTTYGYITFKSGMEPEPGDWVTIIRDFSPTQETNIQNQTAFYPKVIENALDKLTVLALQTAEVVDRCLTYGYTDLANSNTPTPAEFLADLRKSALEAKQFSLKSANSATASETSAKASANSALKSAESAANAAASAQKAGSTDFGIFSEYLVGHNPAWTELDIKAFGGTVTVPINPSNGAYQYIVIDDNGAETEVILSPNSDGATSDDPPFVMLAVKYHGEASSLYFAYDGDNKEPVFITETAGTYIVTMYRISFDEGISEQWYIGNWSRIHELTMNYEV